MGDVIRRASNPLTGGMDWYTEQLLMPAYRLSDRLVDGTAPFCKGIEIEMTYSIEAAENHLDRCEIA